MISILKQVFYTRYEEFDKVVKWSEKLGNPNVSYSKYITLSFNNWRWNSMQGMSCSDIASIVVRLISIPLFHSLFLPKPKRVYENHYELFLLQHLQLELH
jgi:hypothetical protein